MAVVQNAAEARAAGSPEAWQHAERSEALAVRDAARPGAVQAGVAQSAGQPHAAAQNAVRRLQAERYAALQPRVAPLDGLRRRRVRVAPERQQPRQRAPSGTESDAA